jgi:hypothetical protein
MSNLYWLTEEQMARLEPYFLKSHGKPRVDDPRVLSGIVFAGGPVTWFVTALHTHFLRGGVVAAEGVSAAKGEQRWTISMCHGANSRPCGVARDGNAVRAAKRCSPLLRSAKSFVLPLK